MQILPNKFYCENDVPGMPAGYDAARLDWNVREQMVDVSHGTAGLEAIAHERQALERAGRHIAAIGGFASSAAGEFEPVGSADAHGGQRITAHGAPAICSACNAHIRMIP